MSEFSGCPKAIPIILPVLWPLFDHQHKKSVDLKKNDQTVFTSEENVHMTDDSIPVNFIKGFR